MTDTQNQILIELTHLWYNCPHLRLCQLVQDISGSGDNFYMTDETFLRRLREFAKVAETVNSVRAG